MVAKSIVTHGVVPTKTQPIGKKTVQFNTKPITYNSMKTVTSIQKPTPLVATINAQDKDEIPISADDDEVTLTENDIRNHFQDTSTGEDI